MRKRKATTKSVPRVTSKTIAGIDKWEVESAVSTLQQADMIKQDHKMMKAVKIEATRRQKALAKITKK